MSIVLFRTKSENISRWNISSIASNHMTSPVTCSCLVLSPDGTVEMFIRTLPTAPFKWFTNCLLNCLTLLLLVTNLTNAKRCKKSEKWLEPWHNGTPRELSNEYQQDSVWMDFKNLCLLVLWKKVVALALEGLSKYQNCHSIDMAVQGLSQQGV